jgi:hypothetical protein
MLWRRYKTMALLQVVASLCPDWRDASLGALVAMTLSLPKNPGCLAA